MRQTERGQRTGNGARKKKKSLPVVRLNCAAQDCWSRVGKQTGGEKISAVSQVDLLHCALSRIWPLVRVLGGGDSLGHSTDSEAEAWRYLRLTSSSR